jgi:hypothetical protein
MNEIMGHDSELFAAFRESTILASGKQCDDKNEAHSSSSSIL